MELFVAPDVLSLLNRIGGFLSGRGTQSYLVGGFVRSLFLERETADIDIAVTGDALSTARRVADYLGGTYVLLDEGNGIARVVLSAAVSPTGAPMELDFSTLRGDIKEDLFCRDFTADAMAFKLGAANRFSLSNLIDPLNGHQDARARILRAVNDTVFHADPARLLRAVR
ncbi:MAG: hypothetical protein PHR56_09440, partial [Dehalococcoidales bacterium]|nr:hypothetical protein [Dehalococcoidales bacterium]